MQLGLSLSAPVDDLCSSIVYSGMRRAFWPGLPRRNGVQHELRQMCAASGGLLDGRELRSARDRV